MSKQAEDFRKINDVLMGVINLALAYLMHHDSCYKKYCLSLAAWNGIEKLKEVAPSLSGQLLTLVKVCLAKCALARERMPEINIGHEHEFPVAAASLTALSRQIDRIRKTHPSLAKGIDKDSLASVFMFTNLAQLAAKL